MNFNAPPSTTDATDIVVHYAGATCRPYFTREPSPREVIEAAIFEIPAALNIPATRRSSFLIQDPSAWTLEPTGPASALEFNLVARSARSAS